MTATQRLGLPYLQSNQAQKHVTLNEALRRMDALVQISAVSRGLDEPPVAPGPGEAWIVPEGAGGAWAGQANAIASWQEGAWTFLAPGAGWLVYVQDEAALIVWSGETWADAVAAPSALQELEWLGLGTSADAENPFAAKLNRALWAARQVTEWGDGDLRYMLNKEAAGNTLSLLMQTGWSGRAENGLTGTDDLTMKVSPDGANWKEALEIDQASGQVRFPQGVAHAGSDLPAALFLPAPVRPIWHCDAARQETPRTFTLSSVAGNILTLTTSSAGQVFHNEMRGRAAVRVWNVSKSPAQPAWVDWNSSATQLRVTDAAHVAGWTNGETLRLADPNPTGGNVLDMVAVDSSAYMQAELGAVFAQKGVFLGIRAASPDGAVSLHCSPDGAAGTAFGANSLEGGGANLITMPLMTPVPSPISGSNLVFFREGLISGGGATAMAVCYLRVLGIWV